MQWEVEQKFAVNEGDQARAKLLALGIKLGEPILEVDHYFNHSARDFAKTDEALRLRVSGEANFITYKGPKIDSTTKTRKEIEVPLPPGPEVIQRFKGLLESLGFRPVSTVQKLRRAGQCSWQGQTVHVTWDEVHQVGTYVELEILADDNGLAAAKKALGSLADQVGFGQVERKSYLELLLAKTS